MLYSWASCFAGTPIQMKRVEELRFSKAYETGQERFTRQAEVKTDVLVPFLASISGAIITIQN